ncbi:MAG: class I SAM-dependent methyltransferase [Candidatus Pacebacteria bacterium]|nr:class I SAM-dependent methyltransferase [Candidatus Paceibacterota bacterium]
MTRSQIINTLIEHYGYKTYLEIGVNTPAQPGWNFDSVKIDLKHGVDPNEKVNADFKMTSDEFFEKQINMKYDVIFIDGLHLFEQVYKDIINSLKWLNENGTIIVHDTNPLLEKTQRRSHMPGPWHGDVWKAILKIRMEEAGISIYTVDTDEGCTVIQKGSQKLFEVENNQIDVYNFTFLNSHRKNVLNLITVKDFKKIMGINNPIKESLKHLKKKYYRGIIKKIYRKIKSPSGK